VQNAPHAIVTAAAIGDVDVDDALTVVEPTAPVVLFAFTVYVVAVEVTGTVIVTCPLLFVTP
jgi:hypothetical protein